jgi:hypothetical protein
MQSSEKYSQELAVSPISFNSFTEGYGGNFYRPLQTFTLVIDMEISGGAAWSFHLGNLILH